MEKLHNLQEHQVDWLVTKLKSMLVVLSWLNFFLLSAWVTCIFVTQRCANAKKVRIYSGSRSCRQFPFVKYRHSTVRSTKVGFVIIHQNQSFLSTYPSNWWKYRWSEKPPLHSCSRCSLPLCLQWLRVFCPSFTKDIVHGKGIPGTGGICNPLLSLQKCSFW